MDSKLKSLKTKRKNPMNSKLLMLRIKQKNAAIAKDPALRKLLKYIEDQVGNAYEVGHAHGGNALRMIRGEMPEKVDIGWHRNFKNIKSKIKGYLYGGTKVKPKAKKSNRSRSKHN